jgi:hypothetical protein
MAGHGDRHEREDDQPAEVDAKLDAEDAADGQAGLPAGQEAVRRGSSARAISAATSIQFPWRPS